MAPGGPGEGRAVPGQRTLTFRRRSSATTEEEGTEGELGALASWGFLLPVPCLLVTLDTGSLSHVRVGVGGWGGAVMLMALPPTLSLSSSSVGAAVIKSTAAPEWSLRLYETQVLSEFPLPPPGSAREHRQGGAVTGSTHFQDPQLDRVRFSLSPVDCTINR